MQLWQLLTIQQLRSRRLEHCQMWQENRKNCTSGIWTAGSRFCLGDVLLWDLCSCTASPSSQAPSLSITARPVMLMKSLAQGLVPFASPSALAQAEMWKFLHLLQTKARLGCLHYLLNLAGSSWRSVPAHTVPLSALWLTGQEEINEGLGQCLPPPFAKRRFPSGLGGPVTECKHWIKAAWALV